jgi:hypothetical protein
VRSDGVLDWLRLVTDPLAVDDRVVAVARDGRADRPGADVSKVARLCMIAVGWRTGDVSIHDQFVAAEPDLSDRAELVRSAIDWLRAHPDVIQHWAWYSEDKRASPSPYLQLGAPDELGPHEVGFYDARAGRLDVVRHRDAAEACADFLYREAVWQIRRARAT